MFHLVSLSLQISLTVLRGPYLGLCVCVACFVCVGLVVGFFLLGKFDLNHRLIPVVATMSRICPAMQEKKKNLWLPTFWTTFLRWSGWASLLAGEEHLRGF